MPPFAAQHDRCAPPAILWHPRTVPQIAGSDKLYNEARYLIPPWTSLSSADPARPAVGLYEVEVPDRRVAVVMPTEERERRQHAPRRHGRIFRSELGVIQGEAASSAGHRGGLQM